MPPVSITHEGVRADDAALDALFSAFDLGELSFPDDGDVLFLRARPGAWMHRDGVRDWTCVQTFKPHADALLRHVATVEQEIPGERRFALVLVLPPRQRDESRALLAKALDCVRDGGAVVVSIANNEGARSGQDDMERLVGPVTVMSKHKCRVFWTTRKWQIHRELQAQWEALDVIQPNDDGWWSRPGLFAWNRVDPASALLASNLPETLRGKVADLGAGFGYLSAQALQRNAAITHLDLYEAEARALEPARENLRRIADAHDRHDVSINVIWHDVSQGLPNRYDAIISNPPFHQGRADLPGLGQRFIKVAADALEDDGELWIVANRHLPYETTLNARFACVESIAQESGYKVLRATEPRR
ncbi:MAG: class I SAM-dependent methyltransferase [Dokdonella sp.]